MIGGIFQQAISLDSHRWTFAKTIELTLPAFPWDVFRKYLPIYEWFCFFNDFHGSVDIPIPWMVWVWPLNDWGWFFTIESSETNRPSECRCCCQKGLTKKGLTRLVVSRLRSGTRTQFRPMSSWARFRVWCWVQVWTKSLIIILSNETFRLSIFITYDGCCDGSVSLPFFLGTIFFGAKLCFRCCQEFIQGSVSIAKKKSINVDRTVNLKASINKW